MGSAPSPAIEVERILRVDHAGEKGAIGIYTAQIFISRLLWPDCVPALRDMLAHERRHLSVFESLLRRRGVRFCHALPLWSLGGLLLGLVTALLGREAIWACTAAVESTVCEHLLAQKAFLIRHDAEALAAVVSIEEEEKDHLGHALDHGGNQRGLNRLIWWVVSSATACAIWMSERL